MRSAPVCAPFLCNVLLFFLAGQIETVWAQSNRFVGSHTCSKCHLEQFEHWKKSAHARPTQPEVRAQKPCQACHTTGIIFEADQAVEMDVGCEECHGPGWRHIQAPKENWLVRPASLSYQSGNDICLACHTQGTSIKTQKNWPEGYQPGSELSQFWRLQMPARGQENGFFTRSGVGKRANMQGNEYLQTSKWHKDVACFTCHAAHGSEYPGSLIRDAVQSNALCITCHNRETGIPPTEQNISEHTHHNPVGRGSICIECHLPLAARTDSNVEKRSHRFSFALPPATREPLDLRNNACLRCHPEKTPEWSLQAIQAWHVTIWQQKQK